MPGHAHLRTIADAVKVGVHQAGGTPFEFNTIAACAGAAQAHSVMRYVLPTIGGVADSIEFMVDAHLLDALEFILNCD